MTKPVAPPWNDGTKNLVRDLAAELGDLNVELPRTAGGLHGAPPMLRRWLRPDDGRSDALLRLLLGHRARVTHYVFSPTQEAARVCSAVSRLRGLSTLHTIPSAPRRWAPTLFFADHTVVVSATSLQAALKAGAPSHRVSHIPVPFHPPPAVDRRNARLLLEVPQEATIVLFPGDAEAHRGGLRALQMTELLRNDRVQLVMACREKSAEHALRQKMFRCFAQERLPPGAVRWVGETPLIHSWIAASNLVVLPAESLVGKVDTPLVLLEAMALGTPVLVLAGTAAAELAAGGAALAVGRDPAVMADATRQILSDDGVRDAVVAAGAAHVEEVHSPKRVAAAYRALYQRLGVTPPGS